MVFIFLTSATRRTRLLLHYFLRLPPAALELKSLKIKCSCLVKYTLTFSEISVLVVLKVVLRTVSIGRASFLQLFDYETCTLVRQ